MFLLKIVLKWEQTPFGLFSNSWEMFGYFLCVLFPEFETQLVIGYLPSQISNIKVFNAAWHHKVIIPGPGYI